MDVAPSALALMQLLTKTVKVRHHALKSKIVVFIPLQLPSSYLIGQMLLFFDRQGCPWLKKIAFVAFNHNFPVKLDLLLHNS